eukprot:scaffold269663_cov37-Tisochrysis_lutea.AAC.2
MPSTASYIFALFGPVERTAGLTSLLAAADVLTQTAPKYPINALVSTTWASNPILQRETKRLRIGLLPVEEWSVSCQAGKGTQRPEYFRPTYSIFHIYNLTQFEFVLYLDTDLAVLHNIDHLLAQEVHVEELRTPTGCNPSGYHLWNTGVWGIKPNHTRFELISGWLHEPGNLSNPCGNGFQTAAYTFLLHEKFAPSSVVHVGCEYNMKADRGVRICAAILDIPLSAVAVVHWSGTRKPHLGRVRSLPEDGGTPDPLERRALDIYLNAYARAEIRVNAPAKKQNRNDAGQILPVIEGRFFQRMKDELQDFISRKHYATLKPRHRNSTRIGTEGLRAR